MGVNNANHQRPDLELVELIRNGSEEEAQAGLDELAARHGAMVQKTVKQSLFKGGCREQAEHVPEVVQDVWLYACSSITDVVANVGGWLYRVSLSTASHHLRRCIDDERSLRQLTPEEDGQPESPRLISYRDARDADEVFERLVREAAAISPRFGVIFVLHIGHGWSFETISEYQERPLDAVRAEYYRGRRKLKQRLGM